MKKFLLLFGKDIYLDFFLNYFFIEDCCNELSSSDFVFSCERLQCLKI